ncbi:MAG: aromatic ring-hydroxylating dioxygenase subunit alpha [Chloroflexota bacterium]
MTASRVPGAAATDDGWLRAAAATDVAEPGSYVVADVDGESILVVRGRDDVVRGFYNVCRHRGTAVTDEPCGKAVRFQCPYHAWIYDLDGTLVRAKHTDDLDDFSFERASLRPVAVEVRGTDVVARLDAAPASAMAAPVALPDTVLTPQEIDAVRKPYRAASLLPGRAYHDTAIHAFERTQWFRRDWICIGRQEEVADGTPLRATVDGESIEIARAADGGLEATATAAGMSIRAETWQGFVFVSLDASTPPLVEWLDDLVGHLDRFDFTGLRSAHRVDYEVAANWKLVAENYSECYHCPGLHPHLNHLTPYDVGADFATTGPWQGGWMELREGFETMALRGGARGGRPALAGMTPLDERRVVYYLVWPTLLLSLHPDYLLVHRIEPNGPERSRIVCEWLFDPATIASPTFDATDAFDFWDLTNRQDWHVCELQQRGTGSRSWTAGRYSNQEPSVHAFDMMVADRYAGDRFVSRRTVRERYDQPVPRDERAS